MTTVVSLSPLGEVKTSFLKLNTYLENLMSLLGKNSTAQPSNFRSGKTMHSALSQRFTSTLDFANVDQDQCRARKIQPNYAMKAALLDVLTQLDQSEKLNYDQCYALLNGQLPHLPAPLQALVKQRVIERGDQMPTEEWQFSTDRDVRQREQQRAKQRVTDQAKAIDWAALVK